ncbi:hypothetical protein [Thermococcus sp.]
MDFSYSLHLNEYKGKIIPLAFYLFALALLLYIILNFRVEVVVEK